MPSLRPERVIRLGLDLNVLFADQRAKDEGVRGTAASMLVDAVRDGTCPAGPVQLITSVPVIENWAGVLRRRFGYSPDEAREKADVLYAYANDGPVSASPYVVVGSGHVPFGSEREVERAALEHARQENADKLFDEITDDRHVLLTALAGEADILATSDADLFVSGQAIPFERTDLMLYPFGRRDLVIAKPSFVAYWLRRGIIPDAAFLRAHPEDFKMARSTVELGRP